MYVKCFEVFDCQVLPLRVVLFGVFLFALIDAVYSGYITDLFSETCLFIFSSFETQVFCLLAGGADVPVAAANTQLAPKLASVSPVLPCQEPVGDHTISFTDGCCLFKAFKTQKHLANASHYIKRSKRSKSCLLVFCYKQLG